MDENRTERLYSGRLPAIAARVAASISYRAYLAKGVGEAAQSECADHNTFFEAYRNCLARLSQNEQR
jgi:hypothetical protein